MRYLFLLLAIPFLSVEAAGPTCPELKKIADQLEKDIQSKRYGPEECDKITPESLGLPSDSIGFSGDWDYRCKDVSAIDAQLKSIENEIALLNGIEGLKADIKEGLVTIAQAKSPDQAKTDTAIFVKNLNVATSLELFMATNTVGKKPVNILSKMITDKADWKDLSSFAGVLKKYCTSFPSQGTVCQPGFTLTQDTYDEINDFITVGENTERQFNASQVKDLKAALSIEKGSVVNEDGKKEEIEYSFGQLAQDLKVGPQTNGIFADAEFQTIKNFPPLSNKTDYTFLNELRSSMKGLKESEGLIAAQGIPDRFTAVLNDLKKRQQWEMKSKLSLVLDQYGQFIPADAKEACDKARNLEKDTIEACLGPLEKSKELKSFESAGVRDLIAEFKYGQDHIDRLDDRIKNCKPDEKLEYPSICDDISLDMADLVAKSQVLNSLKAKQIQLNPDLITFRNFALEKLYSGKCTNLEESNILCDKDLGNIPKEALILSGSASDIIHILAKPGEATVVDQLCANTESKETIYRKAELCALKYDEVEKKTANDDDYEAPVSPGDNNQVKGALTDLLTNTALSVANIFAPYPQQQNIPNQYGPIYPYYPTNNANDISNKIMDPFVAHGMGSYASTPGLPPYSSSGSGGTSSAYNFGTGSRFPSATGW